MAGLFGDAARSANGVRELNRTRPPSLIGRAAVALLDQCSSQSWDVGVFVDAKRSLGINIIHLKNFANLIF
jgi:hypothetical protein